jgi:lactoylglutathione lyase
MTPPRLIGINHVALPVADVDRALAFWSRVFDIRLDERQPGAAFLDLGDQFIALTETDERHFGLVVDDKEAARTALQEAGAELPPGRFLDFRDPFGNLIQVVQYDQIQFTKTPAVLRAMGLA